jgi:hypothetical protein
MSYRTGAEALLLPLTSPQLLSCLEWKVARRVNSTQRQSVHVRMHGEGGEAPALLSQAFANLPGIGNVSIRMGVGNTLRGGKRGLLKTRARLPLCPDVVVRMASCSRRVLSCESRLSFPAHADRIHELHMSRIARMAVFPTLYRCI